MLLHPRTVLGLADGGAHCGVICDASTPTFLLTHWVRDRQRGARLPLEHVVRRQTRDTAALYGLHDRGVLAPGMKADLNVIDLDALALAPPEMVFDLPAQGRRLVQRARGYRRDGRERRAGRPRRRADASLPGQVDPRAPARPALLTAGTIAPIAERAKGSLSGSSVDERDSRGE